MSIEQFGLFKQEHEGPVWRAFYDDLDEAKAQGQTLADKERYDFFIYCFKLCREVARFKPTKKK